MSAPVSAPAPTAVTGADGLQDPREPLSVLFRDLRSSPDGLATREAERRLLTFGRNEVVRRGGRRWPRELAAQFTHPLALLLVAAAALAAVNGTFNLAAAVVAVIIINAVFAFFQERHAEHAVEALASYLPALATVIRDGRTETIEASALVPGDVLLVEEGDRISADARLLAGTVEVDLSTLTGESEPVMRSAETASLGGDLLQAPDMLFSGSACLAGEARALVTRTGMRSEIGRIAALSERVGGDGSPLERQVRGMARLIAVVAAVAAVAFLPLGAAAGLSFAAAISFAIGLLVANVPEGLLPTITVALAVGVQDLARRGAVVKRLSAVETLGSTTVICTDKTGTLTQNCMEVTAVWTRGGEFVPQGDPRAEGAGFPSHIPDLVRLVAEAATRCTTAEVTADGLLGDPTEVALIQFARCIGLPVNTEQRRQRQLQLFRFDPARRLMSTIDDSEDRHWVHTKGAPEAVLDRCSSLADTPGTARPLGEADRRALSDVLDAFAHRGLRVLAVARRVLADSNTPFSRDEAERELCLLGLVALVDPPRPEVPGAIRRAHQAGVRIHVVTGDNGTTATTIARRVGIGTLRDGWRTVTGDEVAAMTDTDLERLLASGPEIVFARSSPEVKLRIADALRAQGEVVAMTGDGVNDAPALRAADIGVAMGRSGTEVARQAGTLILTDDNFTTIVDAIEEGRRVYDNVRKFILYIFTHAVPEVAPFLIFALAGGAIPLPLTVMQILAVDLGTDTLPALALSREPAEPGVMERPPRPPTERVIRGAMLLRSWGFLGVISAALVVGAFILVLHDGGWTLHAPTGAGSPLHHVYQQATTEAWLGIVACQIGTAFAARTDRVSLRRIGFASNGLLLEAIAVALVFAAAIVWLPLLHPVFGTAGLSLRQVVMVLPFPFVVWGSDEIRRWYLRRRGR